LAKLLYTFVPHTLCSINFLLTSLSHAFSEHSVTRTKHFLSRARPRNSAGSRNRPANAGTRNPRGLTSPAQDSNVHNRRKLVSYKASNSPV